MSRKRELVTEGKGSRVGVGGQVGKRRRGGYLGEVRVGVEPALVADLVVTLGAGVEVWLAGGRREVRGLTYGTQRAAGKGSDLGDGVG